MVWIGRKLPYGFSKTTRPYVIFKCLMVVSISLNSEFLIYPAFIRFQVQLLPIVGFYLPKIRSALSLLDCYTAEVERSNNLKIFWDYQLWKAYVGFYVLKLKTNNVTSWLNHFINIL